MIEMIMMIIEFLLIVLIVRGIGWLYHLIISAISSVYRTIVTLEKDINNIKDENEELPELCDEYKRDLDCYLEQLESESITIENITNIANLAYLYLSANWLQTQKESFVTARYTLENKQTAQKSTLKNLKKILKRKILGGLFTSDELNKIKDEVLIGASKEMSEIFFGNKW